jgi:small GTP-binding protein
MNEKEIEILKQHKKIKRISKRKTNFTTKKIDKMTIYDYEFKILMMGEDEGSKAAFINPYHYNKFKHNVRSTIGVDFYLKFLELNKSKIKLEIWDVGGERFRSVYPTYCRGADGAFVLYDITSQLSLNYLPESIQMIRENAGDIPIILVGTKIELSKRSRQVPIDYGLQIAKKNTLAGFVEVSAKENINIIEAFGGMAQMLVESRSQPTVKNPELVKTVHKVKTQKKFNRDTMKSPIPENLKKKIEPNEDKSVEEKLSAFGDIVEKIMQIILKLPDLFDNSLQDLNSKVTNLQNQLTAINQDTSTLKLSSSGTQTLEKLREQFKEFKNVKKCPNCSDVIKNKNIKICEKCGSDLIKERKTNFENYMVNFIEDMQLEIELQQASVKKLEKQVKIKTKIISQRTESQWTEDQDSLGKTRVARAPRGRGNWGYGHSDGWDGVLY